MNAADVDALRTALRTLDLQVKMLQRSSHHVPPDTCNVAEHAESIRKEREEKAALQQRIDNLLQQQVQQQQRLDQLATLQTRLTEAESKHEAASESLRKARADLERESGAKSAATTEIAALRSNIGRVHAEANRSMDRLRAKVRETEELLKTARAQTERTSADSVEHARRVSALELRLRTVEEERDALRSELQRSESRLGQTKSRADRVASELHARERQIAELSAQLETVVRDRRVAKPDDDATHDAHAAKGCRCLRQNHPNAEAPISTEGGRACSSPSSPACSLDSLPSLHSRTLSNFYQREIVERFTDHTISGHTLHTAQSIADGCMYDLLFQVLLPRAMHDCEHNRISISTLLNIIAIYAARDVTTERVLLPSIHAIAGKIQEQVASIVVSMTQASEVLAKMEVIIQTLQSALQDSIAGRMPRAQQESVLAAVAKHVRHLSVGDIRMRKEARAATLHQTTNRIASAFAELDCNNLLRQININAAVQIETMHFVSEIHTNGIVRQLVDLVATALEAKAEAKRASLLQTMQYAMQEERTERRRRNTERLRQKLHRSTKRVEEACMTPTRELAEYSERSEKAFKDAVSPECAESWSSTFTHISADIVSLFHDTCACTDLQRQNPTTTETAVAAATPTTPPNESDSM